MRNHYNSSNLNVLLTMRRRKRAQIKEMISILILSPFYFSIHIRERIESIRELMERYQLYT